MVALERLKWVQGKTFQWNTADRTNSRRYTQHSFVWLNWRADNQKSNLPKKTFFIIDSCAEFYALQQPSLLSTLPSWSTFRLKNLFFMKVTWYSISYVNNMETINNWKPINIFSLIFRSLRSGKSKFLSNKILHCQLMDHLVQRSKYYKFQNLYPKYPKQFSQVKIQAINTFLYHLWLEKLKNSYHKTSNRLWKK